MAFGTLLQLAQERGITHQVDVYGDLKSGCFKRSKLYYLNGGNVNFDCLSNTNNSSRTCDVIWIFFFVFIN